MGLLGAVANNLNQSTRAVWHHRSEECHQPNRDKTGTRLAPRSLGVFYNAPKSLILLAPRPGLEPGTYGLTGHYQKYIKQSVVSYIIPLISLIFNFFLIFQTISRYFVIW